MKIKDLYEGSVNEMAEEGIGHHDMDIDPRKLKPSQKEFSKQGDEMLRIFQNMHHDAGNNDEMDAFIKSHDWELRNFTPDMFPSEEEFFDYDDPFGRVIDIDYNHRVDLSQPIIVGPQHSDGKYSVIDGNHRAAIAQELGKTIKGYFPVKKKDGIPTKINTNETTSAGGIATVIGGLGNGNPAASIYPAVRSKKKHRNISTLRRRAMP
jgi:hypothetical protein